MVDTPISLSAPVEQDQVDPINLVSPTIPQPRAMPAETIPQRAYRAAYGLGPTVAAKPEFDFVSSFTQGRDQDERNEAALKLTNANYGQTTNLITQYISSKQGQLTPEDLGVIQGLRQMQTKLTNPATVFETQFANTYVSELDKFATQQDSEHFWNVAQNAAPEQMKQIKEFGARTIAQDQVIDTVQQEVLKSMSNQSWLGFGADFLKSMFSAYNEAKLRGRIPGSEVLAGGLGANIEQQRLDLVRTPDIDEFEKKLRAAVEPLMADNPTAAFQFLEYMKGQSGTDYFMNQLNTISLGVDVAAISTLGYKLAKGFKNIRNITREAKEAVEKAKLATKDAVDAATNPEQTTTNTAAAVGDMPKASSANAASNLQVSERDPAKGAFQRVGAWLSDMAENLRQNPGTLSQAQANMLAEQTENFRDKVIRTQQTVNKIDRISFEKATDESLKQIQRDIEVTHPELPFLGFSKPFRNATNDGWLMDGYVGKPGGKFWTNEKNAAEFADQKGIKDYTVERKGLSVFLRVTKPIREDSPFAHEFIVNQTRAESLTPESWVNAKFGLIRSSEDTFSEEQRINRKATVFAQAVNRALAQEEAKMISDIRKGIQRTDEFGEHIPWHRRLIQDNNELLSSAPYKRKSEWRQFQQMLTDLSKQTNPETNKPGVNLESVKELQDYYWDRFSRAPTWTETQAYFATLRLNEMDYILRNISLVRNQHRLGAEMHTVVATGADGKPVKSTTFAGVRMHTLPKSKDIVAIIGDAQGQEKWHQLNKLGKKLAGQDAASSESWKIWQDRIKSGEWRLIRIYDPELTPLNGFGNIKDTHIRYVLTKNSEVGPLTYDQINRTGGIHHVHDYTHYAKQAIIKADEVDGQTVYRYVGDKNMFGVENRAMGRKAIDALNEVFRLMKEGKTEEAKKIVIAGRTPWEWSDIVDKTKPKVVDGKHIPPQIDINEPIYMVPDRTTIGQMGKDLQNRYAKRSAGFVDGTHSGSDARAFQIEFTGERDSDNFMGLKDYGTKANPVFRLEQGEMVDPLTTLGRALNRIIHSNLMDDYKISAIQSWLAEAKNLLKPQDSQITASPYYYFRTINRDSFVKGDELQDKKIDVLLANKFKIDQLIGTPHKLDNYLHGVAQDIADATYARLGPKFSQITPAWLMPTLKDPFQYFRSWTFNAYLGLFAVPQLIVQNMTWASIYAISPSAATRGSVGTILHQMARFNRNPEIHAALDKVASKFGFKPGEWLEAFREGEKTGFFSVGGEWAGLNRAFAPKVIRDGKDTFLHAGQFFFREGEQNVRYGAWYTAYKEWRNENPTGKITQADRNKILDRADLLYGNMSTASNSMIDRGVLSTATQFYAYNIRLAEIFTSGTGRTGLTLAERNLMRARLVGMYSLMYGLPGALGLSGLPLADYVNKNALEGNWGSFNFGPFQSRGYNLHEPYVRGKNGFVDILMNGAPAMLANFMTGKWYNFSARYGVGGVTQPRDLLYSDAAFWKTYLGASYTLITNTAANSDGFLMWMNALVHNDPKMYQGNITDAVDFLKEIQGVKQAWLLYTALNTHKWINKNYDVVGKDVTGWDAFWRFISGTTDQAQTDVRYKGLALKDRAELAKYAEDRFVQEFKKSLLAAGKGDYDQATQFMYNGLRKLDWSGWPKDKQGIAISRAVRESKDLLGRVDTEFYRLKMNGISTQRRQELENALTTIEKLKNQK